MWHHHPHRCPYARALQARFAPRGQEALSQWQRDVRLTPDEPLGLFSFFPGRSFPLRPSPFLRRSPNVPLALNSTTQVPPSRCRGCRVHSRNEGLAGHRAVCERQATPAALSVATIESAALPENTTSDGLHAGLRPGGAREKPVYSIVGTHTPVHLSCCAQHGPCRCHPRSVEIAVGLDIIPSAFPHVGYVCSKLSLRCPSWWRLVRLMLDAA